MTKLVLVRHGESECFGSCPAERLNKYELVFKRVSEKVWNHTEEIFNGKSRKLLNFY